MLSRLISRKYSVVTNMPTSTSSSPFAKVAVEAIRRIYPEKLADKSFDNTGLLLEAPHRPGHLRNIVLLTNDLTKGVADEAIAKKVSLVLTYHPIIFFGLKALTLANSQQSSLLRLAQEGISVYSPHTAVDASPGGINDWLAEILITEPSGKIDFTAIAGGSTTREVVKPVKDKEGHEDAGYGRIIRFHSPIRLGTLTDRMMTGLGPISGLTVAVPQSVPKGSGSNIEISTVGICAGSGGDLLNGLDVDLFFTGEMSHHETLAIIEKGKSVVTAFHSNSERRFLRERMVGLLEKELEVSTGDREFSVIVSEVDRDPYQIIIPGQTGW